MKDISELLKICYSESKDERYKKRLREMEDKMRRMNIYLIGLNSWKFSELLADMNHHIQETLDIFSWFYTYCGKTVEHSR